MAKRNPKRDPGVGVHAAGIPSTTPGPRSPHPALGKKSRDWKTVLALLTGLALVAFLAAAYLVFPNEVPWVVKVALGLVNATLAGLFYASLTMQRKEKDRLLRRLRRGQHIDFGRELRIAQRERRKLRLPIIGETTYRVVAGSAMCALVFAWWLTPWAPVAVRGIPIPDVSGALGEEIVAVVLGMPDAEMAVPLPPAIPPPLLEKVKVISEDREESDPFDLAMRLLVESPQAEDRAAQLAEVRGLLDGAMAANPAEKLKITIARAQTEMFAGNYGRALTYYQQAAGLKSDDPLIFGQTAVAWMLCGNQSPEEEPADPSAILVAQQQADAFCDKACELADKLPEDDPKRALCMHLRAALTIARSQDFQAAEKLSKAAQDIWEGLGKDGSDHPFIGASCNNLAVMNLLRALYTAPVDLNQRAERVWAGYYGETSLHVAASYANTAMFHYIMGRYEQAREYNDRSWAIRSAQLPADHPALALNLELKALLALARGEYAEAEPPAQQALEAFRTWHGDKHPSVAAAYGILGQVYTLQGRYELAQKQLDRRGSLEVAEEVLRPEHPYRAVAELRLARFHVDHGRQMRAAKDYEGMNVHYQSARRQAQQALESALSTFIDPRSAQAIHPIVGDGYEVLGRLQLLLREEYLRLKDLGEDPENNEQKARLMLGQARQNLGASRAVRKALFEKLVPDHPSLLAAEADQAALTACLNAYAAITSYEEVIAETKKALGDDHPAVAALLQELGRLYLQREDYKQAVKVLGEALKIRRARLGAFAHPALALTLETYAEALVDSDPSQAEEARKLRSEAADIRAKAK